MHTLHLLRHAKSSWKENVEDHERQLSKKGREAAKLVGHHLPAAIGSVDLVLCSSAVRTRQTLELALSRFVTHPRCLIERDLYLANCDKLMARLRQLDETTPSVLLIGHNPGLHELAVKLATPDTARSHALTESKFPTGARVSFEIFAEWSDLGHTRHRVIDYVVPASLVGERGN
jgi:phosphohistidine phosphatase